MDPREAARCLAEGLGPRGRAEYVEDRDRIEVFFGPLYSALNNARSSVSDQTPDLMRTSGDELRVHMKNSTTYRDLHR